MVIELDPKELLSFVRHNFSWRNADVYAWGQANHIRRLGEIAGYIYMMQDQGRPRADSVRIILPPAGAIDAQALLAEMRSGIQDAFLRFDADEQRITPFVEAAAEHIQTVFAADFEAASLAKLLDQTPARQAVIVGEAAHYRVPQAIAPSSAAPRLYEDEWSASLYHVMLMSEAKARASDSYIILELAETFPSRASNLDLLKSAGDVGLCGGSFEDPLTPEDVIDKVGAAFEQAAAGEVGKALAQIDADATLSEDRKWYMRLMVLDRGGLRDEVSALLDSSTAQIDALRSEHALGIARIAASIDRDDFAQHLIERALPNLRDVYHHQIALEIALDTRRSALVRTVSERVRALHPSSNLLRSVDGHALARTGDYAGAAERLAGHDLPGEREIGGFYRQLAEVVAGPGFADPIQLARDLVARNPDFADDAQREIIRSLERAGRRGEAVALILSGEIRWTENWFVFAKNLLARALASGSDSVTPEVIGRLVEEAAAYIAEHPSAGYARTSVADLLDAEHLGLNGLVLMADLATARAVQRFSLEPAEAPERPHFDRLEQLPQIVHRVLSWLGEQGDGVVLAGRDTIPAEVLGEDPDAVLMGVLQLVDHHVPDPNDPTDELMMRQMATVALAIAPAARDPDMDLRIVRGVAVKLMLTGRPQAARDLAELLLTVAGERPERRRRALAAFSDIYTRSGRLREALLTLMAAFDLPSDGSWPEVWTELGVLLRVLRDLGLTEASFEVIALLRAAAEGLEEAPLYHTRLDTLALHAELRRHQAGAPEAWSASELRDAATANGAAVLELGDEPLPTAIMLQQLIDRAGKAGAEPSAASLQVLEQLTVRMATPHRLLVAAAGEDADAAAIAAVAGPIQAARYSDDASYDLAQMRTLGDRLARRSVATEDPTGFAYAIELLSAQGVGVHVDGEVRVAARILGEVGAPLAAAQAMAAKGLPVVGLTLDEQGLAMMTITAGDLQPPITVDRGHFDRDQLPLWSRTYPYGYCNPNLAQDVFRTATAGLGVPGLPERAVIISGDLVRVPPNVLTVDGDLAGLTRSLAVAPSMAWLEASMAADRKGDGSAAAWVPIATDTADSDTLQLMAEDIEAVLSSMTIPLHTQVATPASLSSADLAIVGAHGGLVEPNQFFRGLSDDRHEPADFEQLVDALRGSRVAVLFVCSGGRVDRHPESGGLVGIAHRLLDKGLDAVVAPAWPIPFNMAKPWLRGFLPAWADGALLIDAYRAGNAAVIQATSYDLSRSLAMTLSGNPYLTR